MKKMSKFLMMITSLMAISLAGCNANTGVDEVAIKKSVTEVVFDQDFVTLEVGETVELTPTITYKTETPPEGLKIKWITSDINVCSVDNGLVTAIGSGEANVSLIAGYKMATCSIVVPSSGSTGFSITISDTEKTMLVGEQYKLSATPSVEAKIAWNSSDATVASVDENGLVSALRIGQCDIGASALGNSVSCHVTVLDNGNAFIRLNAANVDLAAGDTFQLTASLKEEATVTWSSSNTDLATVSNTGLVTAKDGVEGTVTITAEAKGEKALCVFNIVNDEDVFDVTIYFFIDYNNIDPNGTIGEKLLAKFRWYNDQPLQASGKVPANPSTAMDPAFPYFIGWSSHTIIDSKADLWKMDSDVTGNTPYLYLYGIWADVPVGEFTK